MNVIIELNDKKHVLHLKQKNPTLSQLRVQIVKALSIDLCEYNILCNGRSLQFGDVISDGISVILEKKQVQPSPYIIQEALIGVAASFDKFLYRILQYGVSYELEGPYKAIQNLCTACGARIPANLDEAKERLSTALAKAFADDEMSADYSYDSDSYGEEEEFYEEDDSYDVAVSDLD